MSNPVFMSPEHVAIMNDRLAASPEVSEICAGIDGSLTLLYALADGPDGATVYWSVSITDTARFGLDKVPADVTLVGAWRNMILASKGELNDPGITPEGDLDKLATVIGLIEQLRPIGAVAVEFPEV